MHWKWLRGKEEKQTEPKQKKKTSSIKLFSWQQTSGHFLSLNPRGATYFPLCWIQLLTVVEICDTEGIMLADKCIVTCFSMWEINGVICFIAIKVLTVFLIEADLPYCSWLPLVISALVILSKWNNLFHGLLFFFFFVVVVKRFQRQLRQQTKQSRANQVFIISWVPVRPPSPTFTCKAFHILPQCLSGGHCLWHGPFCVVTGNLKGS